MKKFTLLAFVAIVALGFGSCGKSTPKADLKDETDTLAYAIGISQSNGLKDYLMQQYGVDSTYADEFIKGLNDGANAGDDKKKTAYFVGLQIGQQISNQMVKGINHEVYGEDTTKTISLKNLLAGFISGYTGKKALMTQQQAQMFVQTKMSALQQKAQQAQAAENAKKYADNKKKGEDFLAKNKTANGVQVLPSGVQYKIVKAGSGKKPTETSTVTVKYEGKTLDGKVFDSTDQHGGQPATLRANQVIPGWTDALKNMPVGSTWEIWIPQELAYGAQGGGDKIKPFSCLYFKIELISAEDGAAPAAQPAPAAK